MKLITRLATCKFPVITKSGYFITESRLYRKQNLHTESSLYRQQISRQNLTIVDCDQYHSIMGVSFDGSQYVSILGVSDLGVSDLKTSAFWAFPRNTWGLHAEIKDHRNSACTVYLQALDQLDQNGKSLLHLAVSAYQQHPQNALQMVKHLAAAGADLNVLDIFGETPISDAFWIASETERLTKISSQIAKCTGIEGNSANIVASNLGNFHDIFFPDSMWTANKTDHWNMVRDLIKGFEFDIPENVQKNKENILEWFRYSFPTHDEPDDFIFQNGISIPFWIINSINDELSDDLSMIDPADDLSSYGTQWDKVIRVKIEGCNANIRTATAKEPHFLDLPNVPQAILSMVESD